MWFFLRLFLLVLICYLPEQGVAAPQDPIYQNNNIEGGMTFTGNTLGLATTDAGTPNSCPGIDGEVGVFITTNQPLPTPVCTYPDYLSGLPFSAGTTLQYVENSSSAYLDIPSGSTVVYAELIWSGSYGFSGQLPLSNVDLTPVTIQYETGTVNSITHNPNTAQSIVYNVGGFYVRSQTVTSLIQANGVGYYTVGNVPGTRKGSDQLTFDAVGWVLAVVYENSSMYSQSISLWVDLALVEPVSPMTPLSLTGFSTPVSGSISGLLYSATLEGDCGLTGDQLLFGATNPPLNAVSGINNPVNNFFASQINTLYQYSTDGNGKLIVAAPILDTRGSYGVGYNGNPFTGNAVTGQRQGMDISAVDISSFLSNSQTTAFIQGTTLNPGGDVYAMFAQGLMIQVNSPIISFDKTVNGGTSATVTGGSTVTFDFTLVNTGQSDATNIVFQDDLTAGGFTYVPGTFFINGVLQPDPDLSVGVSLSDLMAEGPLVTIQFQAVTALAVGTYANAGDLTYQYLTTDGSVPGNASSNGVDIFVNVSPEPPVANDDTGTTSAQVVYVSPLSVLANDTGSGILVTSYDTVGTAGGTVAMDTSTNPLNNGFFVYTLPTNFSGNDSFGYTITDIYNQTASATVFMTILPQAISDNVYSMTANTPLVNATPSVLDNDLGSNLSIFSYNTTTNAGGTVVMITSGVNAGIFTYTPLTGFSGTDAFNYTIQDFPNLNQSTATVIIFVLPVAEDGLGTTPANTPLNGTVVMIGTGVTVTSWQNSSTQGGTVTFTDTTTGAYTYTPPTNYSGIDTFTYTITDGSGNTSTGTVTVTVIPIANNDTGTTYANVALITPISVLVNDVGTTLTINTYTTPSVAGGTISMPSNGIYTYIPPLNFSGQDCFNYTIVGKDNVTSNLAFPARVTITVLPVANDSSTTTPAQTALNGNVTFVGLGVFVASPMGTVLTAQGGTVTFTAPTTGAYTYVPPIGFSGIDTFDFTVQDLNGGVSNTATVTITVTPVAGNPTYNVDENVSFNGPSVFTDSIASNPTLFSPTSGSTAQGGAYIFNPLTGTFVYTPPMNFVGPDSFSYTIQDDSGQMATGVVTLIINTVQPPSNCTGCVKTEKFLNTTEYTVSIFWTASTTPGVAYYQIYYNGQIVAVIPAGAPFVFKTCLASTQQAGEYQVVAVDANGNTSSAVTVEISSNCESVSPATTVSTNGIQSPTGFIGCIRTRKFLNTTEYNLYTSWKPSLTSGIVSYRIYRKGAVVAVISADSLLVFKTTLHFKQHAGEYQVAAVDGNGDESDKVAVMIGTEC